MNALGVLLIDVTADREAGRPKAFQANRSADRDRIVQERSMNARIVVIGGTGLIGAKVVSRLKARGFDAIAASPQTGVNAVTGEGLAKALRGAAVVVDVVNSPSFEAGAVKAFFQATTSNLARYARAAGVGKYVALSIVGIDRLVENPYFRAKLLQERLIQESRIPFTIVRATQFFEFVETIADSATNGDLVRIPPVSFQPMAADDVAAAVSRAAIDAPANGVVEVAGPERFRFDELICHSLRARGDRRRVVADERAAYFGGVPRENSLVPLGEARLGSIRFQDWMSPVGA